MRFFWVNHFSCGIVENDTAFQLRHAARNAPGSRSHRTCHALARLRLASAVKKAIRNPTKEAVAAVTAPRRGPPPYYEGAGSGEAVTAWRTARYRAAK